MAPTRRDFLQSAVALSALPLTACGGGSSPSIDSAALKASSDDVLAKAVAAADAPGVVAALTTPYETVYSGARGVRTQGQAAPMDMDTVMWIASMTKPITTVAAMQLVEQGKLKLDEPAASVIPELANVKVLDGYDANDAPILRAPRSQFTLRQLLTHTSGFTYDIWNANLNHYYTSQNVPAMSTGKAAALRVPISFDPGTRWEYGIGVDWVGQLVEAASGMTLGDYFKRNVTGPLGMTNTDFKISDAMRTRLAGMHLRMNDGSSAAIPFEWVQSPEFQAGGAGLYSTAADYLLFLRMILKGGSANGVQVLKPETVALMSSNNMGDLRVGLLHAAIPLLSRDAEFFPGLPKTWGLGFMINLAAAPTGRAAGSLAWAGLGNTFFWIDPARQIAGVTMMQLLPFVDPRALNVYYGFESGAYAALR